MTKGKRKKKLIVTGKRRDLVLFGFVSHAPHLLSFSN